MLERHSFSKHTQENREYRSILVSLKEIEFLAKVFPQRKLQAQLASLVWSMDHFWKK